MGKTRKDRNAKAFQRNAANKRERAEWLNTPVQKRVEPFPYHTCNGKKNRYIVTGKGGVSVRVH